MAVSVVQEGKEYDCMSTVYTVSDLTKILKIGKNTAYALMDSFKESSAIIHVYVGGKENREILHSAELICRLRPSCKLYRMNGLRHGEFSINHADQYANAIRQMVKPGWEKGNR